MRGNLSPVLREAFESQTKSVVGFPSTSISFESAPSSFMVLKYFYVVFFTKSPESYLKCLSAVFVQNVLSSLKSEKSHHWWNINRSIFVLPTLICSSNVIMLIT